MASVTAALREYPRRFADRSAWPPRRRDALVALAWLVFSAADIALEDERGLSFTHPAPTPVQTWPFLLALVATLLVRHRQPLGALIAGYLVLIASEVAGGPLLKGFMPVGQIAFLTFCAARAAPTRRDVAIFCAIAFVGVAGVTATFPDDDGGAGPAAALWAAVMLIGLPVAAARAFRSHERLTALLDERAAQLEAQRDERARLAVAEERERIAGELHDVVAHGVSAMVVQAAAARRLIAVAGDTPAGQEAIAAVETSGRAALDELRRLLGVLRRGDEALALAPQPSLARVDRLIARLREDGRDVALRIEGDAVALPPGLDLTAYRIVEETLAQAGGPARVTVRYAGRDLELEVADTARGADDDGPAPVARFGVRERAALFGGEVHAGPARDGAWTLTARLPIDAIPAGALA
ncbi:sensor histidine kinase [Baekduia sp. Peel2402]|uniref:sensor histidine kinase n=1 Tax=Baekduia sp. Peel2402 TaxID=3458296 RepID=UPI00403EC47D